MLGALTKLIGGSNDRAVASSSPSSTRSTSWRRRSSVSPTRTCAPRTHELRGRLGEREDLDDILPEAFAAVREAAKRTLGQRHFDVQLIGGAVLHEGKIAEMRTGEGKTLVATLPALP